MKESLTRAERIRSKKDYKNLFTSGKTIKCFIGKLVFLENGLSLSRFAVTFVRNSGNAVQRNYSRRFLKELYRKNKFRIKNGTDMVIVLYSAEKRSIDLERQFDYLMTKSKLFY